MCHQTLLRGYARLLFSLLYCGCFIFIDSYFAVDDGAPRNEKYTEISDLVEHPITVQPAGEPNKPVGIPVMLTSKERKKLRRQRRREAEKEKQEKIQFGMIEKPEPKVFFFCSAHVYLHVCMYVLELLCEAFCFVCICL